MSLSLSKLPPAILDQRLRKLERAMTWGLPALVIPTLRYLQDPPATRKQLYIRDFTTYTVAATAFFGVGALAHKALGRTQLAHNPPVRQFVSFLAALTTSFLYSGIGAVKLSNKLVPNKPVESSKPASFTLTQAKPSQPATQLPVQGPYWPNANPFYPVAVGFRQPSPTRPLVTSPGMGPG